MTNFTSITLASQVSGATVAPVIVFHPLTDVPIGGTITLTMPTGYFLGLVTSIASTVTPLTATSAPVTAASTTLVLTTGGAASGTAAITMTLTGLTLGAAQAASVGGFKLSSSADVTLSAGVNALAITAAPSAMAAFTSIFNLGSQDSGSTALPVLQFTPGTDVMPGQTIALHMPPGYFLGTVTSISSTVPGLTATSATVSSFSTTLVLTTAGAASGTSAITMTLTGLTLGAAHSASTGGFKLSLNGGALSNGLDAPEIAMGTTAMVPHAVMFTIAQADRIPFKNNVPVTLSFTTSAALPTGGKITLHYPAGFFATTAIPTVAAGATSAMNMTVTCDPPTATAIVITTAVVGIPASTHFTITLSGLTMGAATAGSATGITVQTSVDTAASSGVSSGPIDSGMPSAPMPLGCVGQVLSPNGCSGQAAYFITELTPIFCPQGMTFAPNGVTVVGTAMCPVPLPSPAPAEVCRPLPVPVTCSAASIKIANIPEFCGSNMYSSPSGFDHLGCPLAPPATTSESGSGLVANPCTPFPLDSLRCGSQAAYLIVVLSPVFCPFGFSFAPFGVTAVNSTMCPVTRSNLPGAMCRAKPVPAACSEASKLVANVPDLCDLGSYSGPGGFDPYGCPVTPTSGGGAPPPAPPPNYQQPQQQSNALQLAFEVSHLCPSQKVTRDCLVKNPHFRTGLF